MQLMNEYDASCMSGTFEHNRSEMPMIYDPMLLVLVSMLAESVGDI